MVNKDNNVVAEQVRSIPYFRIGYEVADLVLRKQAAYGDSFGKSGTVMRLLYPDGISPDKLDDALAIVRIIDKLFRIANQKEAFVESPWLDIIGYGLLAAAREETHD